LALIGGFFSSFSTVLARRCVDCLPLIWTLSAKQHSVIIDAILRSRLYAGFGESLSGLATIRAYDQTQRFLLDTDRNIEIENRALWAFEITRVRLLISGWSAMTYRWLDLAVV